MKRPFEHYRDIVGDVMRRPERRVRHAVRAHGPAPQLVLADAQRCWGLASEAHRAMLDRPVAGEPVRLQQHGEVIVALEKAQARADAAIDVVVRWLSEQARSETA